MKVWAVRKGCLFLCEKSYKKIIKLFILKHLIFAVTTSHKIGYYGTEKNRTLGSVENAKQKTIF